MIREIFEKEFSHGNSSPPCSVFFLCCVCWYCGLVLSPDESPDSLSASWDDTGRARSSNREVFSINTDPGAIFPVYALLADLDQGQKPISSGLTLGMRTPDFFSLCTVVSSPQTLSPIFEGRGRYNRSSPAVGLPVPGVQIVECGTKEEREKKIRRKRGRGLSPLPHPLFVCLFVFFLLTSSLRCPQDLNSWNRLVSRARGKLTRKGKKKQQQQQRQKQNNNNNNKQGASRFTRLRLTRVGPL